MLEAERVELKNAPFRMASILSVLDAPRIFGLGENDRLSAIGLNAACRSSAIEQGAGDPLFLRLGCDADVGDQDPFAVVEAFEKHSAKKIVGHHLARRHSAPKREHEMQRGRGGIARSGHQPQPCFRFLRQVRPGEGLTVDPVVEHLAQGGPRLWPGLCCKIEQVGRRHGHRS